MIGRIYRVRVGREIFTANCLDTVAGTNQPKRLRIQTKGPRQGDVLMPCDYQVIETE